MRAAISGIRAAAYTVPTDGPEADGTLSWHATTLVLAHVEAGGKTGIGYTYASRAAAQLITEVLAPALAHEDAMAIPACWKRMQHAARNLGVNGQIAAAISAVDNALWDLKAKLLHVPLLSLLGPHVTAIPVYGSGGFTTYGRAQIESQIESWRNLGITMAKIKIGTYPEEDNNRVKFARGALGDNDRLFVDANGAYTAKQALYFAHSFHDYRVSWFEEPVTSDNLEGLRLIREHAPEGMDITAGEYADSLIYARRMLQAESVDVMQLDATRIQGLSGFMAAAAVAAAHEIPVSSHCAPALHAAVCCHLPGVVHMEYFYDHVRLENMVFDGVPEVRNGMLIPNLERPGMGLELKARDVERFAA